MPSRPRSIEFNEDEPAVVVEEMGRLAAAGKGWINVTPAFGDDEEPEGSVALCTWVVGQQRRNRLDPDTIGIQHATGGKAGVRLAPAGVTLPEGWRTVQDHRRRGLVVAVGGETDHGTVLTWLLQAGTALTDAPFRRRWRADVFEGR